MALTMAMVVARDRDAGPPVIPILPPSHRQIIREVAVKHGLQFDDVFRRTRATMVVRARDEVWCRILDETATNMYRLAHRWDYDHVTVSKGIGRHRARHPARYPARVVPDAVT